jgi:hypothetical protein
MGKANRQSSHRECDRLQKTQGAHKKNKEEHQSVAVDSSTEASLPYLDSVYSYPANPGDSTREGVTDLWKDALPSGVVGGCWSLDARDFLAQQ